MTTNSNDKREKIILAAYKVLSEQGYDKASTKEIAREAGVAQGLINYYFPSKDDLYIAVLKHEHCDYCDNVKRMYEDMPSPDSVDGHMIHAVLNQTKQQVMDQPGLYKLRYEMFALGLRSAQVRPEIAEYMQDCRMEIEQLITHLTGLPHETANPFASMIYSIVDGFALQKINDPNFDIDSAYRIVGDMIIAWLKSLSLMNKRE